jgi:hypothetical protein
MADGAVVNVAPEELRPFFPPVVLNSFGLIDTVARKTAVAPYRAIPCRADSRRERDERARAEPRMSRLSEAR